MRKTQAATNGFWRLTAGFGADGIEVNEPRPEDRSCDGLQGLAYPAVHFDLVVERAKNMGNRPLFFRHWKGDLHPTLITKVDVVSHIGLASNALVLLVKL